MAVFVCGLDETAGRSRRDRFFMGGFVAPEADWSQIVVPRWEEHVLSGPPRIPYLHMTDIRSPKWRQKYGLSRDEADCRLDAAIEIIDDLASLSPIGVDVDGGEVQDILADMKILHPSGGHTSFDPDYLCFMTYSYIALSYVALAYPSAEELNFMVEKNGRITKFVQAFHAGFSESLEECGRGDLVHLLGKLIPAGKEQVPLQAADILCWHTVRPKELMDDGDRRRFAPLARKKGMRAALNAEHLKELAELFRTPGDGRPSN